MGRMTGERDGEIIPHLGGGTEEWEEMVKRDIHAEKRKRRLEKEE